MITRKTLGSLARAIFSIDHHASGSHTNLAVIGDSCATQVADQRKYQYHGNIIFG
jgi:hypothetical protein